MLTAAVTEHLFWITSRAAGTAALLLSSLAVCVGLLFGGKLVKGRPDLRHLHEALSLATIVALVVHAVSLLGDSFLHPSIADITIPFVSGYLRLWTTVGIVAGWAMIALGLSYYVRDRIGQQRWKKLHRFTALAWLAGLAHSFGEGTDAGATWFIVASAIVVVPAFVLLIVRHLGTTGGQPARPARPARPAARARPMAQADPMAHAGPMAQAGPMVQARPARQEIARQEVAR
jgi:sulfoxide reductase heme-binding subunit YedZ